MTAVAQENRLWTKKDAARFFNCSEKTIDRMVDAGEISPVPLGIRSVRFDPHSLIEHVNRKQREAALSA